MCLLIVLRGLDTEYPIVVASNRDEYRQRYATPPTLHVGARRRMIGPRDSVGGGTWMAVNDHGLFAGLTNVKGAAPLPDVPSRGLLPLLALDQDDLDAALAAVEEELRERAHNPFQLLLCDARRTVVLYHDHTHTVRSEAGAVAVISNEHRLGALHLPQLEPALAALPLEERLARLRPILLDQGAHNGHRILKDGGEYGTVSSSLVAIHATDKTRLVWHYAAGQPDQVADRNYGNLGKRL